jgi:hypothetical protein
MSPWPLMFVYAIVVAVLVRALTREEIFKEPRQWFSAYYEDERHPFLLRKLAYMPTCEFCCSFWVSLIVTAGVLDYRLGPDDWRGVAVGVFAVMGLANVYLGLFSLLRVDLRQERTVTDQIQKRRTA